MPLSTHPATLEMLPSFAKQDGDIIIAQLFLGKVPQEGLAIATMILVLVLALSPFLISAPDHSLMGQALLLTQPNGLEW